MSIIEQLHSERMSRKVRLRAIERPFSYYRGGKKFRGKKPIDPAPFYPHMWFWELISLPPKRPHGACPKMKEILQAVSKHFDISITDICSARRQNRVNYARQVAMYLTRRFTLLSLPNIGRQLNDRDHTTIINGVRRIESRLLTSTEVQRDIEVLIEKLGLQ